MFDVSTLKRGDIVADKDGEEHEIFGAPYLVDGVWHVEATWEDYAHIFKQGDIIHRTVLTWPIAAKARRKMAMENGEHNLSPEKAQLLKDYDPADYLMCEIAVTNFLKEFENDKPAIKAQAEEVAKRARIKHNLSQPVV